MKISTSLLTLLALTAPLASHSALADILAPRVKADLIKDYSNPDLWQQAGPEVEVSLVAQPMTTPRPLETSTSAIKVSALHDGKHIAFRLRWADPQMNDATRLQTYSDAVALQFPIKDEPNPPAIFMGHQGSPVHIFHWRYQYQLDAEHGAMRTVSDAYPNMVSDMYPADFKIKGNFPEASTDAKQAFSGGIAAGNPQSYLKPKGVDELMAEGFGTLVSRPGIQAQGHGDWSQGQWQLYLVRPLAYADGSNLKPGASSNMGFAVWQGEAKELGGLKSLSMSWTPLKLEAN